MTAEWLVIKYVPDLLRNEPRNVGVVAFVEGASALRLAAVDEEGTVNGHRAGKLVRSTQTYRGWVNYWRSLADASIEQWLDQREVDNYQVVRGGTVEAGAAPTASKLADEMFGRLVAEARGRKPFQAQVSDLLTKARLTQDKQHFFRDYAVNVGRFPFTVPYAWSNGLTTVAEQMGRYDEHRAEAIISRFEVLEKLQPETQRIVILDPQVGDHDDDRVRTLYELSHPVTTDSSPSEIHTAFTRRIA